MRGSEVPGRGAPQESPLDDSVGSGPVQRASERSPRRRGEGWAVTVGGGVQEGRRGADDLYPSALKCKHQGNRLLVTSREKPRPETLASRPTCQGPRVFLASCRFAHAPRDDEGALSRATFRWRAGGWPGAPHAGAAGARDPSAQSGPPRSLSGSQKTFLFCFRVSCQSSAVNEEHVGTQILLLGKQKGTFQNKSSLTQLSDPGRVNRPEFLHRSSREDGTHLAGAAVKTRARNGPQSPAREEEERGGG